MTDEKLIEMFKRRDEGAIRAAEEKYRNYCLAIAANYLALNEDREECVNDAFLALWNQIPPDEPKSFSAYLAKIVRTLALERSPQACTRTVEGCQRLEARWTRSNCGRGVPIRSDRRHNFSR